MAMVLPPVHALRISELPKKLSFPPLAQKCARPRRGFLSPPLLLEHAKGIIFFSVQGCNFPGTSCRPVSKIAACDPGRSACPPWCGCRGRVSAERPSSRTLGFFKAKRFVRGDSSGLSVTGIHQVSGEILVIVPLATVPSHALSSHSHSFGRG